MRRLVTIDLRSADIALFEAYEAAVLPLLTRHGATLELRLRAADNAGEVHLVHYPDEAALNAYQQDPDRLAARGLWDRSGAQSSVVEVEHYGD